VTGHQPRFSLGCRLPTGSRINSPEVVTRMRETARSAELRAGDGETWRCAAFCGRRNVVERSEERLPAVAVGAPELRLPPPGRARRSSDRLRTRWVLGLVSSVLSRQLAGKNVSKMTFCCVEFTEASSIFLYLLLLSFALQRRLCF